MWLRETRDNLKGDHQTDLLQSQTKVGSSAQAVGRGAHCCANALELAAVACKICAARSAYYKRLWA